jgi:[protein-PII] uridylyltransferase
VKNSQESKPSPLPLSSLAESYSARTAELRNRFEAAGDALGCIRGRSALVDSIISCLYAAFLNPDPDAPLDFCLIASGGYGRQELYPFSDIDLVFVSTDRHILASLQESIAAFVRTLWDLKMRVGHNVRTVAECGQLYSDNLEFNVSLLDFRYLAGDAKVFETLRSRTIPHLVARDQQDLVRNLIDATLRRHAKHGKTIFQLEPNIKEAPGGLRDYQVARWLSLIHQIADSGRWPGTGEPGFPKAQESLGNSWRFLSAVRCFLHYQRGRDDNLLTYELQEQAAALGLDTRLKQPSEPARWMRSYFLHTRSIHRWALRLIGDALYPRSSLYGLFQDWRSRFSNTEFSVIRGRVFPRLPPPGPNALTSVLSLFEMVARHRLEISGEAEAWVEEFLGKVRLKAGASPEALMALLCPGMWVAFRRILVLPNAAGALREMHSVGLLTALFPEFSAIDALVIRDFYHRYTVDEHSFMTIQNLGDLQAGGHNIADGDSDDASGAWSKKFGELYSELERPDLLALALLFHDVGKGMPAPDHVQGSLRAAQEVCARLGLDTPDAEAVLFLIARHLEMSATITRRDIFDPETVRSFAAKVGAPERLKMLCLFTYADIAAVNPEALTPWKAEMLWRLYAMTFNHLSRSLDEDRVSRSGPEMVELSRILPLVKRGTALDELNSFLDGFPRRYLETHSPEEIAGHFALAQRISHAPVQVSVRRLASYGELTVIAEDRPYLFACITGTLAGWGMNILKADAFGNRAGTVLDVVRFHDLHRTLDLNPSELPRLQQNLADVLMGNVPLEQVMAGRVRPHKRAEMKVRVPTQVLFDDAASRRCTLMELIAQDRPGLLYEVSSTLARCGCNIEVALIDTEAQKAIDVFYLTAGGHKLGGDEQEAIRLALLERLPGTA